MLNGLLRWRVVLLVVGLAFAGLAAFLSGQLVHGGVSPVTVRAGSGTVSPGGNITIPVDALNVPEVPGQGTFTIEVKYDTNLLTGIDCTADPDGIWDFANCNADAPGIARCTGVSISGVSGAELGLCDITFQASPGVTAQTLTPLNVNCVVKTDPDGISLTCNEQNGEIKIFVATPTPTPTNGIEPVTVRAGSKTVQPSENFTIPVDALNVPAVPGQGTFTIEVKYDTSLLTGKDCTADPGGIWDFANCNADAPGIARCTGVSISGVSGAELRLCDIAFGANPDITEQTLTPLDVNCVVKTDPDGISLTCNEQDGEIKIGDTPPVTVRVGDALVFPPGNVTVPVEVLNLTEAAPLGSATIDVQYETAFLTAKACDANPDGVFDLGLCEEAYAPDTARCTGIDGTGETGDVVLCTVSFDVSAGCVGVVPLTKVVVTLETNEGAPIPWVLDPGEIDCDPVQGDVSCDGFVTNVDTLFILQYVIGLRADGGGCPLPGEPAPDPALGWLFLEACDVDKDGDCDSTDALFVFQCVLNLPPGNGMAFCLAANSEVSARPTSGIAGGLDLHALGRTDVSRIAGVA